MNVNTHIRNRVVIALCVLSLTPTLVLAHGTPKTIDEHGIIKSVDMSAQTLVVTVHKKKADQKFQWNDQTHFSEGDKSATASDLKQGEHVRLSFKQSGATPILQSVHIAPAKTEKHSDTGHSAAKSNGS